MECLCKLSGGHCPWFICLPFTTYDQFAIMCVIYHPSFFFTTNLLEVTSDTNVLTARSIPYNLLRHWIDDNYDKWGLCLYMLYMHMEWCAHSRQGAGHENLMAWKHLTHNWPFLRGIYRSMVNSPHKRSVVICFLKIKSCNLNDVRYYSDVIMSAMTSQITSLTIVYSTIYSGVDQRIHESSVSLAFVRGNHRWAMNSPHKGRVRRKMFTFDDVIIGKINVIFSHFPGNHAQLITRKTYSIKPGYPIIEMPQIRSSRCNYYIYDDIVE